MKSSCNTVGSTLILCVMWAACSPAVAHLPVDAPALAPPPVLDGKLDDAAWEQAFKIGQLYHPKTGTPAPETRLWLARDDAWLYIAVACRNANMEHVEQLTFEHDGPVFLDESVEILIDPGTGGKKTLHFMLNFANVKHEKTYGVRGANAELGWSGPWRSITKRLEDGWQAEIAIPLFALQSDNPDAARVNFIRNKIVPEIDNVGAKQGERRESHVLTHGNTKDASNYAALKGLGGVPPQIPFYPIIENAALGAFKAQAGGYVYPVLLSLAPGTETAGKAAVFLLEEQDGRITEHACGKVEITAPQQITVEAPLDNFHLRAITAVLRDEAGSLLCAKAVANCGDLAIVKKAFVSRNYYTSEMDAELVIQMGAPEIMLPFLTVRVDAENGGTLFQMAKPAAQFAARIPLTKLTYGRNKVKLVIDEKGGELFSAMYEITKLPPNPGHEVKADLIRKVILRDGAPFFPIGIDMMGLDLDERHYKMMAEIGFNMLMPSAGGSMFMTRLQEGMELARKYNLQILFEGMGGSVTKQNTESEARANYEKHLPLFKERVKLVKNHPNLFMYFTGHEPNLGGAKADIRMKIMEWLWKDLEILDPHRPKLAVYSKHIPAGDDWTRWVDVLSDDIYIRPWTGAGLLAQPGLGSAYYAHKIRLRCEQDGKIMLMVPLAGQHSILKGPIGNSNQEMLCQNYTFLIEGARGLLFFANTTVASHATWEGIKTICAQIKHLAPALLNHEVRQEVVYPGQKIAPLSTVFPQVIGRAFKYPDGDYLLLAVNLLECAAETEFIFPGAENVVCEFGDKQTLAVADGKFMDKLEPYGTRAYRVRGAIAQPVAIEISATADQEARSPAVDVPGIIRQMQVQGKNYCPNPCFERQLIPGVPDFCKPFVSSTAQVIYNLGMRDSAWFVDDQVRWEGHPSLCLNRTSGVNTPPGAWHACYPPTTEKPMPMVFSIHAKAAQNGNTLIVQLATERITFELTEQWQRYAVPAAVAVHENTPGVPVLVMAGINSKLWISGMQLEAGAAPTEFQDDSMPLKKAAVAEVDNLLINGGAEEMSAAGWQGLECFRPRAEHGLRRGLGRTGDYAFYWRGQSQGIYSEWVAVDPKSTYQLSGYFKANSGVFHGITFGLVMADEQRRQIRPYHVCSISGTRTELAAPCQAGDRILRVRNAVNWRTGARFAAVFGVEENQLSFEVTPLGIDSVRQDGVVWVVALGKPCGWDKPAGTPVVQNRTGGGGIFMPGPPQIPDHWTEISGSIGPRQWWSGTAYARVVIVGPGLRQAVNATNPPVLLMDDFSLRKI